MEHDERRRADDLDRHWDEVQRGRPGSPPPGQDADLADLIERLHATGPIPRIFPDPQRAWREFQRRERQPEPQAAPPRLGVVAVAPAEINQNGRVALPGDAWPRSAKPRRSRARVLANLATAALLLLTLAAGLLLLRVVRPGWALPPSAPLVETLLDTTVEAGGRPGMWVPITVERWTFAPGPAALTVPPLDGVQWVAADGGTLAAAVDGQERELEQGKALVVEAGQELALRNAGTGEAAALRGVVSVAFANEVYDRSAISQQLVLDTAATKAVPVGASRVVLVRLTLPPGSALPPAPTGELDWFGVVAGRLGLTLDGAKLPVGWKSGVEREVAAFERLPRLVPGTEVTLRNAGAEALVVLRLTVLPVNQVSGETGEVAAASASVAGAHRVPVVGPPATGGTRVGVPLLLAGPAANFARRGATMPAGGRVASGRRRPRRPPRSGGEAADGPG